MPRILLLFLTLTFALLTGCASTPADATDEELMQAVNLRENQAHSIWYGGSQRTPSHDRNTWPSSRHHSTMLDTDPGNKVLSQINQRVFSTPDAFLPLLSSKDPEVVLTGLFIYARWADTTNSREVPGARDRVATAVRAACAQHPDTRIRWTALRIIVILHLVAPQDVDLALKDRENAMHEAAANALARTARDWSLVQKNVNYQDLRQYQAIGIQHLTDDDWVSRKVAATILWNTTTPEERASLPDILPTSASWVYKTYDDERLKKTQAAWDKWLQTQK